MKKIVLTSSHLTTQQNILTKKLCNNSCRLHVQNHAVNDTIVNYKYHITHTYVFESNDFLWIHRIFVDVNILQRQILLKPIK